MAVGKKGGGKTTNQIYKEARCYGSKGVYKKELLDVKVPQSQRSTNDTDPTHGPKTPKVKV